MIALRLCVIGFCCSLALEWLCARRILFPGGAPNVTDSAYARAGREMYTLAVAANRAGDHVPIWGTCLGFQLLTACTAGRDLLEDLPAIDTMESICFAPGTSPLLFSSPPLLASSLRALSPRPLPLTPRLSSDSLRFLLTVTVTVSGGGRSSTSTRVSSFLSSSTRADDADFGSTRELALLLTWRALIYSILRVTAARLSDARWRQYRCSRRGGRQLSPDTYSVLPVPRVSGLQLP